MVNLKINGKEVETKEGQTILEASKIIGIDIPTLCYNEEVSPYGACRLCTVEIKKGDVVRLQASCCAPVEEGIEVITDNERIRRGRRMMIELLLSRCPGVKKLQELSEEYGIDKPRFSLRDEECILCGLCTRVCSEIVGRRAIGFSERGIKRKIGIPFEEEVSDVCIACGACTYICPTGATQMEAKTLSRFRQIYGINDRRCRYMMMGVIDYKLCSNNYECYHCEVDQRMEETFGMHPALAVRLAKQKELQKIGEFYLEPTLYYFKGHIWVKHINGRVRLGIDDFAQRIMGVLNEVKLPNLDKVMNKGDIALEILSGTKSAKMLSPVTGKVIDINSDLQMTPLLTKRDPYGRGWLFDLQPHNLSQEVKELISSFAAIRWLKNDIQKLDNLMLPKYSTIIADGGYLLSNLPNKLTDDEWRSLTKEFFLI